MRTENIIELKKGEEKKIRFVIYRHDINFLSSSIIVLNVYVRVLAGDIKFHNCN